MSPIWLIPGLVALVGGALLVALLRSAAEESRMLLEELHRQREVGSSLRRLNDSVHAAAGKLANRRP